MREGYSKEMKSIKELLFEGKRVEEICDILPEATESLCKVALEQMHRAVDE